MKRYTGSMKGVIHEWESRSEKNGRSRNICIALKATANEYKLDKTKKQDLLYKGDVQLLQQLQENEENNKEVSARMKANDCTKLLQESQKKGDFNMGEKEVTVKEQRNVKIK